MRTSLPAARLTVLIFFLTLFSYQSFSQSLTTGNGKLELGLGIGPTFFVGDLGGNIGKGKTFVKDVNIPLTKLMKGIYFNYYPAEWIGLRIAANLGAIEGADSIIDNKGGAERYRKQRNLSFQSNISEAYAAVEFYPTVFLEKYDGLQYKLRPYGLLGFGIFHFNPKAIYVAPDGTQSLVELQPLHLEGQGFPEYPDRKNYSLTQQAILLGGGVKYYLKESMYIGFEILHRKTFTDYLDDVSTTYIDPNLFNLHLSPSQAVIARQMAYKEKLANPNLSRPFINTQRGDPKQNDAFFSALIRFGWRLNSGDSPRGLAKRQLRCPVFY
jgi:hypothetical protein